MLTLDAILRATRQMTAYGEYGTHARAMRNVVSAEQKPEEAPVIPGTDIPIHMIAAIAGECSDREILEVLEDYPSLDRQKVMDAVSAASKTPSSVVYPPRSLKRALGDLVDAGVFDTMATFAFGCVVRDAQSISAIKALKDRGLKLAVAKQAVEEAMSGSQVTVELPADTDLGALALEMAGYGFPSS